MRMDVLKFDDHLEDAKRRHGCYSDLPYIDKGCALEQATEDACHGHALHVFDPLRDTFLMAAQIAHKLTNENAKYYMLYGAGRRLKMMFHAYRAIIFTAHEGRDKPLSHDEQQELSSEINILYMHLYGVLDNYAWCILFERSPELDPDLPAGIHRNDVGLFSKEFRKRCTAFVEIKDEIQAYDDWFKDAKERRDPVAHRIPLYIPPSVITKEEETYYRDVWDRHNKCIQNMQLDEASDLLDQLNTIGTFKPFFVHHPTGPYIPIYPTIPTDMAHLIKIGNAVERCLLKPDGGSL